MSAWLAATYAVASCLVPCAIMCMRGSPERRMVGFEMTSVVVTLLLALFTVASNRLVFMDIPLTLAILTLGGGLVFARFLEKHL